MSKIKSLYSNYRVIIWTILGIGFIFALWWILSSIVKSTLFPGPQVVIPLFFSLLANWNTYTALAGTLMRLLISFFFALISGSILGIIAGLNRSFRSFMRPLIVILKTIPTAAVILILIALMRPIFAPIIIVFLVIFPIIYESFVSGIANIDDAIMYSLKIDGVSRQRGIVKVMLPLCKPYILLGIASSIGLGMKVAIMAEILSGSDSVPGIGRMIYQSAVIDVRMDYVLAISLLAIIIIGMFDIVIYYSKKQIKEETA
ncbi:MAG: ABC transporter permease subunit [Bacilli bacterium]|jgi:NitT/TauT family transport system permease protein